MTDETADEMKQQLIKSYQEVIDIEKKKECSFKMEPFLVDELDKRYSRLGYANRSELFTAFAYTIIDRLKRKEDDLVFISAKDLRGNMPPMTEHQIETHLSDLIGNMLKAVIAMRGGDVACEIGTGDILEEFYARYSIFLTEEEIKHAVRRYELMHKSTLREYRICQMRKHYENSISSGQDVPAEPITQPAQTAQTAYQTRIEEGVIHPDAKEMPQRDEERRENMTPHAETHGELSYEMH